ncbi:MAG: FHA domain-containing protein [Desmonostoc vinosum HA7617-LM4]|jgi:pSer/pThr/pTyr-binding forkhead associated (FHA) protein|nr:FHA domain-containing protein [Desmonostoc vinosum HA7617-LM4]
MSDFVQTELERRLYLYQVFIKLYEYHQNFLDEILQLENLYQPSMKGVNSCYINGVVDDAAVYVITNLCENKTQILRQSQQIWTIGRNPKSGICIMNRYISRHHAAIQYIDQQGFYLIDFNSTNGSFVNGERTYQSTRLQDGDRIRVGCMTFDFFISRGCRTLPTVAMELLMQLVPQITDNPAEILTEISNKQKLSTKHPDDTAKMFKNPNFIHKLEDWQQKLSAEQKSEILDRFFRSTL